MIERIIRVAADPAALALQAAEIVAESSAEAITRNNRFTIALSGGSTPKALFALLADEPYRSAIDWSRWLVFWGDERCVPADHADSNYRMARETLLSKVPIPPDNIYRMEGEIDPQVAAKDYGLRLKEMFGDESLDLVLLGMGPDGHTLSLFPGTTALAETHHRCVANYVEKLAAWRITLTAPFVNKARRVLVMVAGPDKQARVEEVLTGPVETDRLPMQLIDPAKQGGECIWLMDTAAAGMGE